MIDFHTSVNGKITVSVINSQGEVVRSYPAQNNLILDRGLDYLATKSWLGSILYCAAGTGTTPTRVAVSGTASQSGTTVTLSGSSYSFVSGDVGSWLKWNSGEEAKITAFTNSTTVTVSPSQTVASGGILALFRCGQTALDTELKRTGGLSTSTSIWPAYTDTDGNWSQGMFFDSATGKMMLRRTWDHTAETGTVVYTEVGISNTSSTPGNLFSRIVLDTPVTVNNTEKLRVQYNLYVTVPYSITANRPTNTTISITGWPYTYNISGITSTGSNFTVTTSASHHFLTGGKVNIAGASISAYNAEWTIASVTSTTFTVTSALNPGTASAQGTCYNNTKADLYTCGGGFQGVVNSTNITGGTYPTTGGAPTWYGNTGGTAGIWDGAWCNSASANVDLSPTVIGAFVSNARVTPPASFASFYSPTTGTGATGTASSYTNGTFYRDYVMVFASGSLNISTIRSLFFNATGSISAGNSYTGLLVDFNEPQRKDSGFSLTFTFRRSWSRVLS